jgi:hypothetical protein
MGNGTGDLKPKRAKHSQLTVRSTCVCCSANAKRVLCGMTLTRVELLCSFDATLRSIRPLRLRLLLVKGAFPAAQLEKCTKRQLLQCGSTQKTR